MISLNKAVVAVLAVVLVLGGAVVVKNQVAKSQQAALKVQSNLDPGGGRPVY